MPHYDDDTHPPGSMARLRSDSRATITTGLRTVLIMDAVFTVAFAVAATNSLLRDDPVAGAGWLFGAGVMLIFAVRSLRDLRRFKTEGHR